MHPQTFQAWRQKFLDAGKARLSRYGKSDPVRAIKKENGDLKHIIGELTIANDALKKPWRQQRLSAAKLMQDQLSLRRSLECAGVSMRQWYYEHRPREIVLDPDVVDAVRRIGMRRSTYGTRRMAAQMARETWTPTNRKQVQQICRKIGHIRPQKKKNEIIRAGRRLFRPEAPNRL